MTPSRTGSGFYFGHVMHRRLKPFGHAFRYPLFSMCIDVDRIADEALGRLFAVERFGILSFHARDHGPRTGAPLRPWVEEKLRAAGMAEPVGRIRIVCFPRVLGYVFNPISVWFCEDMAGSHVATLYEVNNTFGDRHAYLFLEPAAAAPGDTLRHSCAKRLHVSPFFGTDGGYGFHTRVPDERYAIGIRLATLDGPVLMAAQTGRFEPLRVRTALKALFAYPFLTAGAVAAIHVEALKLWIKGARYHPRPAPPEADVSVTRPALPLAAE